MNIQRFLLKPFLLLISAAVVLCAASPARQPVQHVVFVDLSNSPGLGDAARWLDAADRKVFAETRFGDSLIIYGVHDHTAESAPIFEARVPVLPPDADMRVTISVRGALRRARMDGKEALQAVLRAPARSRTTRLVDSLRRISRDPGRVTEVLYLSDMAESTPELDLERTRITRANLIALTQSAVDRSHVTRGALDGVTVTCVLDSPPLGAATKKANDHQALESFWRLIFTSLGGNLTSFDSQVQ